MLTRLILFALLASPLCADVVMLIKKKSAAGGDRSGVYTSGTSYQEDANPWNTTYGFTVCATYRFTTAAGEKTIASVGQSGSTPGWRLMVNGTTLQYFERGTSFGTVTIAGLSINTWYRSCAISVSANDRRLCHGVSCSQDTALAAGDWSLADQANLGTYEENNNKGRYFAGDIMEVIEFSTPCSDAQTLLYAGGTRAQDIGCGVPRNLVDGYSGLNQGSAQNNLTPISVGCLAEGDGNERSITGGTCP